MKNRTYNILFHTHTVSGIVISVILYIIFFAGSFSFFRDEIVNWERNQSIDVTDDIQLDFNACLDTINQRYYLYGRDIELRKYYLEQRISVSLSASKDPLAPEEAKKRDFFYLNTKTFIQSTYQNSYTLGEFLYRLHFLSQIPNAIGRYLSGFVALFFLFAIITGILIHWKKIIPNFFVFRPLKKLKTLWTDAHTSLGVIGLPFQFVYAVTGAFFMLKVLLMAPNVMLLYNGNQTKFYDDLEYGLPHLEMANHPLDGPINMNGFIEQTKTIWNGFNVTKVHIFNYGNANMHVLTSGHLGYADKFSGAGEALYKVECNQLISQKNPQKNNAYLDGVKNILYRLHFGDYGGYALKITSFVLGLISCFVIISGVMIWLVARNRNNLPEKKRRFNLTVVRVYLAICLSMYPITAASFIAVKTFQPENQTFIYGFYFIGWLLLSLFYIWKKQLYFINKHALLSGSILGLLIPIANGLTTGNWFWNSFVRQQFQIFFVDMFWLVLALVTLWISCKITSKDLQRTS